ncbi:MAG TPA: cupin domain-containing protein [Actinomycetota bacterium]
MTYFTTFLSPRTPQPELRTLRLIAGRPHGLERLLLASGRMAAGYHGYVHLHAGDEVVRVLGGEVVIRIDDERQTCHEGDVAVIPPNTLHGLRAVDDALVEIFAERDMGTFFPVRQPDGSRRLVEIYRPDSPWNAPPPRPGGYTTDQELAAILRAIDVEI